jgi:hypothetical protein
MRRERAAFWLAVVGLLGLGILVGQVPAVMVAATAGIAVFYLIDRMPGLGS